MHEPPPIEETPGPEEEVLEVEVLDALPVPTRGRGIERATGMAGWAGPVEAAAVAATGFLAGAATLALLHRRSLRQITSELADLRELRTRYEAARSAAAGAPGAPGPFGLVPGRSYLIQIRTLGRPGPDGTA